MAFMWLAVGSAHYVMVGCKEQHDIMWAAYAGFTLLLYSCMGFWPHTTDYTPFSLMRVLCTACSKNRVM